MSKMAVLIETDQKAIHACAYQVLTVAQASHREIYALVLDGNAKAYQTELQAYGAHKVIAVSLEDGTALEHNPVLRAKAVIAVMEQFGIDDLLGITRAFGKDILPRIAAALDAPLVMDCLEINFETQTVKKSHFAGSATATLKLYGKRCIYGLRPDLTEPLQVPVESELLPFVVQLSDDGRLNFEEFIKKEKTRSAAVELTEAAVVISGGRSMGSAENFQMLHECARQIGAAVGSSRAAVDEGFAPYEMQIGQTGKTISPDLYFACGISGAVQHFAGMKTAQVVVAINIDPNAPFF